jgi:hypothetical protein
MASAHITCGPAGAKATNLNYGLQVLSGAGVSSQTLTTTASNAESTVKAPFAGAIWTVVAISGPVYVAFGSNPDATTATARHYCPAGVPRDFAAQAAGEEIAAVDA